MSVRFGFPPVLLVVLLLAGIPGLRPATAQAVPHLKPEPGRLLVANRGMRDPRFAQAVILMVKYQEEGALGLIINQPTEVTLAELLPEVEELRTREDRVYLGGPVAKDGMMFLLRSESEPADAKHVFADIYVSPSRELFDKMVVEDGARFRSYIGYAGWAPGQLESELRREDWHVIPGNPDVVFSERPNTVWEKLIKQTEVLFADAMQRLRPPPHSTPWPSALRLR